MPFCDAFGDKLLCAKAPCSLSGVVDKSGEIERVHSSCYHIGLALLPVGSVLSRTMLLAYAQIPTSAHRTSTFLIHGKLDELIPWQQSMRTVEALRAKGVGADIGGGKVYVRYLILVWGGF